MNTLISGSASISTTTNNLTCDTTTGSGYGWSYPTLIETNVYPDHIEQIFKETSMITYSIYPSPPPEKRVYKIVYSCQEGKWHVSEKIYGSIVPASTEYYDFD